MFHLVDYYALFAGLARVSTANKGPAGFDDTDGIDQWAAVAKVASGATIAPAEFPWQEVVLDLLVFGLLDKPVGKYVVAMRVGDHKMIYGAVRRGHVDCGRRVPVCRLLPTAPASTAVGGKAKGVTIGGCACIMSLRVAMLSWAPHDRHKSQDI